MKRLLALVLVLLFLTPCVFAERLDEEVLLSYYDNSVFFGDSIMQAFRRYRSNRRQTEPEYMEGIEVVCTASKAGADAKRGPERAADGLDATAYVSAVPMEAGDWWMCEFKEPVTGRIRVQTGLVDGTRRLSRGHVEVSKDGKLWSRAASVSQKTGEASFQQRDPIRFVKLLAEPRSPEILTLREMRLE